MNVDENRGVSMELGIRGIPTLVVVKNGREVSRIVGVVPRWQIKSELSLHLG